MTSVVTISEVKAEAAFLVYTTRVIPIITVMVPIINSPEGISNSATTAAPVSTPLTENESCL